MELMVVVQVPHMVRNQLVKIAHGVHAGWSRWVVRQGYHHLQILTWNRVLEYPFK